MRVVFFGTYDARRHPRVQVLIEGFRAHGDEVLECNEPLGLDTAARVEALRRPRLLLVAGWRVLRAWARLRKRARALPPPAVVVVGYLGHLDVLLARWLFPGVPIVLDHLISLRDTAVDRRVGSPWMLRVLGLLDRAAVRACHLVVVDTDEHARALPEAARARAVVVPVGASQSWFAPDLRPDHEDLRVVFFGLFTPLQGAPVIGEAIGMLAGEPITFTLAGSGQERAATEGAASPNGSVRSVDWVEPERLPAFVAEHDVCLGIFGTGEKALRVTPNKVYQGAAAGCAIVTSDTAPQRRALGDAGVFVPPGDAKALAEALRELAGDRDRVRALGRAARARAEIAFRPAIVVESLRARLAARLRDA